MNYYAAIIINCIPRLKWHTFNNLILFFWDIKIIVCTLTKFIFSVFYVFYEQYLTIESSAAWSLGLSLLAIFLVTFLLTGFSIFSAFIVLLAVTMIVVDLGGLMVWWHISLNGLSLVNLVMVRMSYFIEDVIENH